MSLFIDVIYEHGVLRPLAHYDELQEHQHYRLMVVEKISTAHLLADPQPGTRLVDALVHRTTVLENRQYIMDLLGLFEDANVDVSFKDIEDTLDKFRQQQELEWNGIPRS